MICLDATGQMLDSVQLSDTVFKKLEAGGSRLCFVIGGAEGLPPELHPSRRGGSGGSKSSIEYLSLSRLTFTHQVGLSTIRE
jgi:23S rRNA (pseudouridine1915-N3)-methyltransferase